MSALTSIDVELMKLMKILISDSLTALDIGIECDGNLELLLDL